jgi:RNA polymerase sigma-70 factor (ECF subfamily)
MTNSTLTVPQQPEPDTATEPRARAPDLAASAVDLSTMLVEHQGVLAGVALRLCGSRADAHDLVQDTFERALRASNAQMPDNPRAWLLTVLYNLFIQQRRRQHRESLVPLTAEHLDVPKCDPEAEPEWASISQDQLAEALSQLEEPFRRVYELHCVSGVSYEQIAELLGIPRNTVGTRLMRARRKVRALLRTQLGGSSANANQDHDRAA